MLRGLAIFTVFVILVTCSGFKLFNQNLRNSNSGIMNRMQLFGSFESMEWEDFDCDVLGPLRNLGEFQYDDAECDMDEETKRQMASYRLNVGRALDTLRRQLPAALAPSTLDFSIFANEISVSDGKKNRMIIQRSLYSAGVKSMQVASSFSRVTPALNLRKIEYVEGSETIQCIVHIVLPDTIRIDGSGVWEGMFYFGLNREGLINSHIMDRKISNLHPQNSSVDTFAWLKPRFNRWSPELVPGKLSPKKGLVFSFQNE
jgi:hypothetical protein